MYQNAPLISFNRLYAVAISIALLGGVGYWFFKKTPYSFITFKTNSIQQLLAKKERLWGTLWHGMGIYFWNKYLPTWQKGMEPTPSQKKEQHRLLNYNIEIEHIIDTESAFVKNNKRPTVYFHGWGDTKNSAKLLKAFGDVLPGDIITFHFRDHGVIIPKLRHANLGQLPDVLSGLYVLKWAKDTLGLDAIDLFGYSRGGATILNLIAVLHDESRTYDKELAHIGIDKAERRNLLAMIQHGSIVLDCPLTDMNTSVKERMKRLTPHALKLLAGLTKYQPHGLQGLTSALQFDALKLNILLHFQYHDTIVSNQNEAELYRRLSSINPKSTFVVLGNDGGHLHTHASLAYTIHSFRKMFGGSYDPNYEAQYTAYYQSIKNSDVNESVLLQPGKKIEQTLAHYYHQCKHAPKNRA